MISRQVSTSEEYKWASERLEQLQVLWVFSTMRKYRHNVSQSNLSLRYRHSQQDRSRHNEQHQVESVATDCTLVVEHVISQHFSRFGILPPLTILKCRYSQT